MGPGVGVGVRFVDGKCAELKGFQRAEDHLRVDREIPRLRLQQTRQFICDRHQRGALLQEGEH